MPRVKEIFKDELLWEDGVGQFIPSTVTRYDRNYFLRFQKYEKNPKDRALTKFRVDMVQKILSVRRIKSWCLDIGIGSGHFLRELRRRTPVGACGIDVNDSAISLINSEKFNVCRTKYDIMTFWDSLEHIPEPWRYWEEYSPKYIACSLPIFVCKEHVMKSKHFHPYHRWYFTREAFVKFMRNHDYDLIDSFKDETDKFGRQDIQTFTFMVRNRWQAKRK